jgi:dihydrofolate synthase/folylpolyglutamate synthase
MTPPLPRKISTRQDLEALLRAVTNYEEKRPPHLGVEPFKLDRVVRFLAALGHPQRGPSTVHVAGSKGKGTTVRLLAAVLERGGRGPVGLYTSPHLVDLSERITVNGRPIDDEALAHFGDAVLPYVTRTAGTPEAPTFFEIMTAVAWLHFRARECASVVLETGLGGRLDATNVCDPSATIITSIEREHTQILGDTIEAIAGEKAGILKPDTPAATAAEGSARDVIRRVAREVGAPLAEVGRDLEVLSAEVGPGPRSVFELRIQDETMRVVLPVAGRHHATNALLAAWAAHALGIDAATIAAGMAEAHLPGLLEVVSRDPMVVVDGAHTPASAAATHAAARAAWPDRPRVLLVGLLEGKDPAGVLGPLLDGATAVVTTTLPTPRSLDASEVARAAAALTTVPVLAEADPDRAFALAAARVPTDGYLLAAGSVRLAGWVRGRRPAR